MQFQAWEGEALADLRANHTSVGKYAKSTSRTKKTQLSGKLKPLGSRKPKGGRPGDGYGPYAHQSARDVAGIEALFAAARVSFPTLTQHKLMFNRIPILSWRR